MNVPRMLPSVAAPLAVAAVLLMLAAPAAHAGLGGQPAPSKETTEKIAAATVALRRGEIGTARPALLLAVETNALADLTDLLARAIGDDTTYYGLADTFDAAAEGAKSETDRAYAGYNLARLHLLRAGLLGSGPARRGPLDAAARAAARFDPGSRDPGVWELTGDIASARGDLSGALAAYRKINAVGGGAAYALWKQGVAYTRAIDARQAITTLDSALRAAGRTGSGGSVRLRYDLYQDLAGAYLLTGRDGDAQNALAQSIKAAPTDAPGFRWRTDVARRLLARGLRRPVREYAVAALRAAPDDFDLQSLRDEASR